AAKVTPAKVTPAIVAAAKITPARAAGVARVEVAAAAARVVLVYASSIARAIDVAAVGRMPAEEVVINPHARRRAEQAAEQARKEAAATTPVSESATGHRAKQGDHQHHGKHDNQAHAQQAAQAGRRFPTPHPAVMPPGRRRAAAAEIPVHGVVDE